MFAAINAEYKDGLRVRGHCEVSKKTCPVYDYKTVLNLDKDGKVQAGAAPKPSKPKESTGGSTTASDSHQPTKTSSKNNLYYALTDKGPEVLCLQKLLVKHGVQCAIDGDYGQGTVEAVEKFQSKYGLKKDGVFGRKSAGAMIPEKAILKMGNHGTPVQALQLLMTMYNKKLIMDGDFGKGTKMKLIEIQKSKQLDPDGKFGPNTRRKLVS